MCVICVIEYIMINQSKYINNGSATLTRPALSLTSSLQYKVNLPNFKTFFIIAKGHILITWNRFPFKISDHESFKLNGSWSEIVYPEYQTLPQQIKSHQPHFLDALASLEVGPVSGSLSDSFSF